MKKFTKFALLICFCISTIYAQHSPVAEPVYGGYVEHLSAIPLSATETRVFIAPNSANSLFYTDISNTTTSPVFSTMTVVPDFSSSANMGTIRKLAADENSGFAFAALTQGGLYGTDITSGSSFLIESGYFEALEVYDGILFAIVQNAGNLELKFGNIDPTSGTIASFTTATIAPIPTTPPRFDYSISINPSNQYVYVFIPGTSPVIYKSSDVYSSLSSSSTFSTITTSDLSSSGHDYAAMGIAPDGRIFVMSYEGNSSSYNTYAAYSDSDGDPWMISSVADDAGRGNISIVGNSTDYVVYYSRIASRDKGTTWEACSHADGAVVGDPNNNNISYVRTDWGFGIYDVTSHAKTEANDGFLAVQVYALGMNVGKSIGWVAAKSGIFHVSDYDTPSPTWDGPIWPDGDSTPYNVAVCDQTGTRAYFGNASGNVFRYDSSNGDLTDPSSYESLFRAEDDAGFPDWSWTYGTRVSAIAIDHASSTERIFVGLYDFEDWDETTDHLGAIFEGVNTGTGWTWTQITSSEFPDGLDVLDMIAVTEGGNTVLYVGVERNTALSTTVNGVYRIEETSPGVWSASKDLYASASYPISASIYDLTKTASDTLFACGSDASYSNPVIYKKALGDTYWTAETISGLISEDNVARSITFDNVNTAYLALENKIYYHVSGTSSWSLYYEYPLGTELNFIYYDDLLAGTEVGLFMHPGSATTVENEIIIPTEISLQQNYPNPFNPSTVIEFSLPSDSNVKLSIFDVLGQKVAELINGRVSAGNHKVNFNSNSINGNLNSGIYFYTLETNGNKITRKMMLLK